jgi:predicted metal-dependent hydrolase
MKIGKHVVRMDGRRVPLTVLRSRRARHVRLEYTLERGLLAVLPPRVGYPSLRAFLREKEEWLRKSLNEAAPIEDAFPRRPIASGRRVLFLGRPHRLRIRRRAVEQVRAVRREGRIELVLPTDPDLEPGVELERWYRHQASRHLHERTAELAERLGLRYRRLTVRTLRTAWGLCNDRRGLTLNWRLIMAPSRVVDYVILHELTHLEYLEHTPRFWRRMERRCPNYRAFEDWIARFGPVLDLERDPDLRRRDGRLRAPLWGARF